MILAKVANNDTFPGFIIDPERQHFEEARLLQK